MSKYTVMHFLTSTVFGMVLAFNNIMFTSPAFWVILFLYLLFGTIKYFEGASDGTKI